MKTHDVSPDRSTQQEAELARILEAYLVEVERGRIPDREAIIAAHPEIAERLRVCLSSLQFVNQAAVDVTAEPQGTSPESSLSGTLGDFQMIREVGRGGMGVVYEAQQISLGRRVALKVLPFAAVMDPKQLQRFKTEAQAAARLHHQNIVPVHSVGCHRGVHYYAMQFIEGQTLAQVIADLREIERVQPGQPAKGNQTDPSVAGQLVSGQWQEEVASGEASAADQRSEDRISTEPSDTGTAQAGISTERSTKTPAYFRSIAQLGADVADALDYAHDEGVIHRDIKPSNLILDGKGQIWVTDFGLARIQSDPEVTLSGDLVGTLRYMSPEQALAKRVLVDHRTDVYSLGVTLYELLTLRPALPGRNREELLREIAFEEPKSLRRLNRAVPAELETIVLKAMAKNPAERYSTAAELAEDMRRYLDDRPIRARRPTFAQQFTKWTRRHRTFVWTAAVMLLIGTIVSTWQAIRVSALLDYERQVHKEQNRINARLRTALAEVDQVRQEAATAPHDAPQWTSLRKLVTGVETLAESELADPELASQVQSLRQTLDDQQRDFRLLDEMDEARTRYRFGYYRKQKAYKAAFSAYGIELQTRPPTAAARIRRHGADLQREILAGLDDWMDALVGLHSRSKDPEKSQRWIDELRWVGDVARLIDSDPLRQMIREADQQNDAARLLKLAQSDEIQYAPPYTFCYLSRALRRAGDAKAALAVLQRGHRRYPSDKVINMDLFYRLSAYEPPQHEETLRIATVGVALSPNSGPAWMNLGGALMRMRRTDAAIDAYRRALEVDPGMAQVHRALGLALSEVGKHDEAIKECRRAVELVPENARHHRSLGFVLWESGDLDGAEKELRTAVQLSDEPAESYHALGRLLCDEKHEYAAAADVFQKIIELDPNDGKAHHNLGYALQCSGRIDDAKNAYRDAVAAYQKAIATNRARADTYHNLGHTMLKLSRYQEAVTAFQRAAELLPTEPQVHRALGDALKLCGRLNDAKEAYQTALKLDPKSAENQVGVGEVHSDLQDYDGAVEAFQNAIKLRPGVAKVYYKYGNALLSSGRYADAIPAYQKAINLQPSMAEAHCNLGHALLRESRFDDALASFRRGHELGSVNPNWQYPSGLWLTQAEQCARLDPQFVGVVAGDIEIADNDKRLGYALLGYYRKEYAAAVEMYRQAFQQDAEVAEDFGAGHRYTAVRCAVLAASGQGRHGDQLDDEQVTSWHRQALEWLEDELVTVTLWMRGGEARHAHATASRMQFWQSDSDLSTVHEGKLPQPASEDHADWQDFWNKVKSLEQEASRLVAAAEQ